MSAYRDKLVQQIKDSGQELINRAESMVSPEVDMLADFQIDIHFTQYELPEITYKTTVVNRTSFDRLFNRGDE